MSEYKVVPLAEVGEPYADMAQLAVIFSHEIIDTGSDDRSLRWKPNSLMTRIKDETPIRSGGKAEICFNTIVTLAYKQEITVEEWMKFYMQIGYSLCGFSEIFDQRTAKELSLPKAKKSENIIEYMLRVHDGKILKI